MNPSKTNQTQNCFFMFLCVEKVVWINLFYKMTANSFLTMCLLHFWEDKWEEVKKEISYPKMRESLMRKKNAILMQDEDIVTAALFCFFSFSFLFSKFFTKFCQWKCFIMQRVLRIWRLNANKNREHIKMKSLKGSFGNSYFHTFKRLIYFYVNIPLLTVKTIYYYPKSIKISEKFCC